MKKLLKLGLLSLLMGSLVVTSGCYKKDIDDLEDRLNELESIVIAIENPEQALAELQEMIDDLEESLQAQLNGKASTSDVITDINIAEGDGNFLSVKLTYTKNGQTVTKTLNIPYTPGTSAVSIVKGFTADNDDYYELLINDNNGGSTWKVVRLPKISPATGVNVKTSTVETTVGQTSYALIDINPSNYVLTVARLGFEKAGLIESRAEAGDDLPTGLEVTAVTNAVDFAEENEDMFAEDGYFDGFDAIPGRWVISFEASEELVTPYVYKYDVVVKIPAAAMGIWANNAVPAVVSGDNDYVISGNQSIIFSDYMPTFTDTDPNTTIAIQAAPVADPAVVAVEMDSDEEVGAVITIKDFAGDPNFYLEDQPVLNVGATNIAYTVKLYNGDVEETTADTTTLKTYLVTDEIEVPDPAVEGVWKNVTFSMIEDVDMDPAIFPAGYKAVYTVQYTATDAVDNQIFTNTFEISVTRVRTEIEVTPFTGAMYIPSSDAEVNYGSLAASGLLHDALQNMGYADADIAEAAFTGFNAFAWTAGTPGAWSETAFAPVAPEGNFSVTPAVDAAAAMAGELKVTIPTTIPVGKFRLAFTFHIDGRDVTVFDEVQIVAPTIYMTLNDLTTLDPAVFAKSEIVPNPDGITLTGTEDTKVAALQLIMNTADAVNMADLLNLTTVKLGVTYEDGVAVIDEAPVAAYAYSNDGEEHVGDNTYGICAIAPEVELNKEGTATLVQLYVQLASGQKLPVVVNEFGWTYSGTDVTVDQPNEDWRPTPSGIGNFYVAATGNAITAIELNTPVGPHDLTDIIANPVLINDIVASVTFADGTTWNDDADVTVTNPADETVTGTVSMSVFQRLMDDVRFKGKVVVTTVPINDPLIQATELITLPATTETVTATADPTTNNFDYTLNTLSVKGIAGITVWDGEKTQQIKISVTDIFGSAAQEGTAEVQLTHAGE